MNYGSSSVLPVCTWFSFLLFGSSSGTNCLVGLFFPAPMTVGMQKQEKHPPWFDFAFALTNGGFEGTIVSCCCCPSMSVPCFIRGDPRTFRIFLSFFSVLLSERLVSLLPSAGTAVCTLLLYVSVIVSAFLNCFLLRYRTGSKWTWDEFEFSPFVTFMTSSSSPPLVPYGSADTLNIRCCRYRWLLVSDDRFLICLFLSSREISPIFRSSMFNS